MSNLSDGTMHPVEQADAQTAAQPVKLATVPSSPMAEGAHEPLDAAAADARAVLETWKAANPWWRTAKNKDLPPEFWDLRRRMRNQKRTHRQQANKAKKRKAESQEPEEELTEEEAAARAAEATAAKDVRVKAHLAQQARLELALREGMRIVVDCSFILKSSEREMRSLAKQLQECVAANKRAPQPARLTFTSFQGELRRFCEKMGGERWAVNREEGATLECCPSGSVVMLTPDAPRPLDALDPAKTYVVGGLVDRTPRKGVTATFAEEHNVEARRLPIAEQGLLTAAGMPLRDTNFILNVNDVVSALLVVHGGAGWRAAIDAAVPMRKRLPAIGAASAAPAPQGGGGGGAGAGALAGSCAARSTAADGAGAAAPARSDMEAAASAARAAAAHEAGAAGAAPQGDDDDANVGSSAAGSAAADEAGAAAPADSSVGQDIVPESDAAAAAAARQPPALQTDEGAKFT